MANKVKKSEIMVYCRCELCGKYFEINVKRKMYCSRSCVNKSYYRRKVSC